ncbi:hypothetical protein F4803DRAFT_543429 [Xylaria telfairii]|nr:hypothetical protein F4803DRAFT_543429 [Xylaria telfairii]
MEEFTWDLQELVRSPPPQEVLPPPPAPTRRIALSQRQRLALARTNMTRNGWCCHQVNHLSRTYDFNTFLYLTSLEPHPLRRISHEQCSTHNSCVAYNTEAATYQTRHTTADCTCAMVTVPYESLIKLVRRNKVPLISIERDADNDELIKLKVEPRLLTSKYIAISHVWADGLGNPTQNALPICQLKELKQSLLALRSLFKNPEAPCLFWMDTLCIPVQEDHLTLRLGQIGKMASIYKGAVASLVLDVELMATSLEFNSITNKLLPEARARIACSAWMTRSWTLQEGMLPRSVAVRCLDDIIVLHSWGERSMKNEEVSPPFQVNLVPSDPTRWPSQTIISPPDYRQHVGEALERALDTALVRTEGDFSATWNALCTRSTTQSEDVPLIFTNVTGLLSQPLFEYSESYEMLLAIFLSVEDPPLSLFFNAGPRYDPGGNHYNRWVPQEVRGDILLPKGSLSVGPSHLSYECTGQPLYSGDGVSVYTVDSVVAMHSTVYLHCQSENAIYKTDPSTDLDTDELDTTNFTTTYFIIDQISMPFGEQKRRGACFYAAQVNHAEEGETDSVDLIFNCPLRVLRGPNNTDRAQPDQENVFTLTHLTRPRRLKIRYDPPPNFAPLRIRGPKTVRIGWIIIALCFVGLMIFIGLGAGLAKYATLDLVKNQFQDVAKWKGIFLGLFPVVCIVGLGAFAMGIPVYLIKRALWNYILSFEIVRTNRRSMRGEV